MWQHQRAMVKFALQHPGPGVMWAADMGTGKTRAAIELMRRLDWPKTLVVAPSSVVRGVWPHQLDLWGNGKRIEIIDGAVPAAKRSQLIDRADILLINYESAYRQPTADYLVRAGFGLLVLDESHRIKAPGGVTSRYIARLADRIPHRLALTGTPMPHSPMDIYAQYRALDKTIYGTSAALFRARYAILGGFTGKEIISWQREDELRDRFESIAYQVRAADVLTLPPFVDSTIYVDLSKRAATLSRQAETAFAIEIGNGTVTIANALVKLLRLQQITSGYLQPEGEAPEVLDTSKRDALEELLKDLYEPAVVVFCRFRHDVEQIKQAALATGYYPWEVSGERKQVEEWKTYGGVLATQIRAGGLGLDLTDARTAVYYSMGFSLGDYLQSRARLHRPGQERSVQYVHLIARKTIDERVMFALKHKQQVVEHIVGGNRADSTRIHSAQGTKARD